MDKSDLIKNLEKCVEQNSRYEVKRNYLSMSRIGECARVLYFEYLDASIPYYQSYAGAFLGYTFEDIVAKWLIDLKILDPGTRGFELSAFDGKFKGHTDGLTFQRELIEIKSLNEKKFDRVRQDVKVPVKNFLQAQTYMYHGNFSEAIIFYVCRETMRFEIKSFKAVSIVGQRTTEKAKRILRAVDQNQPPSCECGYCIETPQSGIR